MPKKKVIRVIWIIIVVFGVLGMLFFSILPAFTGL